MKINKIIVISLSIIFVLSFITSCKKEKDRYYNKEYDFSIKLPADWEIQEGKMNTVVLSMSYPEHSNDDFRENINIVVDKNINNNLEDYFSMATSNFKKYLKDYHVISTEKVMINGQKAIKSIVIYEDNKLKIKLLQYYLVKDNKGYVITCAALTNTFENYEALFEKVSNTFKFEND